MISKNKLKLLRSLAVRKHREEEGLFIAEGDKIVRDLLSAEGWKVRYLFAKKEWLRKLPEEMAAGVDEIIPVSFDELRRISYLKTPHNVLAVAELPAWEIPSRVPAGELALAFENIQDPGNLGTIIRTANWFGIRHLFCSPGSVDVFNPKVVQASMGAFLHVRVHYTLLEGLLLRSRTAGTAIYGTFLEGEPLFHAPLEQEALVIFGNESKGISPALAAQIPRRLTIPPYGEKGKITNSLNISTSAAVVCAFFRSRHGQTSLEMERKDPDLGT